MCATKSSLRQHEWSEATSRSRNADKGNKGTSTRKGFLEEREQAQSEHPAQEWEVGANAWTWWGHPIQNAKLISKVATPRHTWIDRPNLIYFGDVDLGNYGGWTGRSGEYQASILLMIKANVTETRTELRGMLESSLQPFYRWANWGPDDWTILPQLTQLIIKQSQNSTRS